MAEHRTSATSNWADASELMDEEEEGDYAPIEGRDNIQGQIEPGQTRYVSHDYGSRERKNDGRDYPNQQPYQGREGSRDYQSGANQGRYGRNGGQSHRGDYGRGDYGRGNHREGYDNRRGGGRSYDGRGRGDDRWSHDMYSDSRERNSDYGRSGDYNHRGNDYDRGGRGRETRGPPPRKISDIPEVGIICSVKDTFGFIKCLERDEDLFFHFTELPMDEQPRIGLEVEFLVATDPRSGKVSGVQLRILPKGTVKFEELLEPRLIGYVVEEIVDDYGVIEYEATNENGERIVKPLQFFFKDLEHADLRLERGDKVEFNIIIDNRKQLKRATNITVVNFGGERETGLVIMVKDNYGFIKCCDRLSSFYFNFNDIIYLQKGQSIDRDLEVEYTPATDKKGKDCAVRVVGLPKGSISFTLELEGRYRGIVETDVAMVDRSSFKRGFNEKEKEDDFGTIQLIPKEGEQQESVVFTNKDIDEVRNWIHVNDEVEFNLVVEKRTGKKRATHIVLIKAAPEQKMIGIVEKECKLGAHGRKKDELGLIVVQKDTNKDDFSYSIADVKDVKKSLWPGDQVQFNVSVDKRTKTKNAVNIELIKAYEHERETGRISSIKGGFGFIKCAQRDKEVYFHFSELEREEDARVDADVEFSIVTDSWMKKPLAVNIKFLPEGSVKFVDVLEGRYKGTIENELRGRGFHTEGYGGRLLMLQNETEDPISLEFGAEDIDKRFSIRKGDKVEFSIAVDNRTKSRRATNIVLQREFGTVSNIKKEFGFIASDSRKEDVFFHLSEVSKDILPQVGDRLEFIVTYNPRTKAINAQEIILLPPEDVVGQQRPMIHKMEKDSVTILRQPLTPDSTPKFSSGRGRLMSEERNKLIKDMNSSPRIEEKNSKTHLEDAVEGKNKKNK